MAKIESRYAYLLSKKQTTKKEKMKKKKTAHFMFYKGIQDINQSCQYFYVFFSSQSDCEL